MPIIYLSPSTQENNLYVSGGTEEEWMNRLADAMEPYLTASGIRYSRNTPDMTAASSIAQSNEGNYDLHLALHSNAAPPALAGTLQGSIVFYNPDRPQSKRAAEILADYLRQIYPQPDLVSAQPTDYLGEVLKTKAPGVLIEYAFHDNCQDATWIRNNIPLIAKTTVEALTEYFGIPFVNAQPPRPAVVRVSSGCLNIRSRPNTQSAILRCVPNGHRLTVVGTLPDWYVVEDGGQPGYAASRYIRVE